MVIHYGRVTEVATQGGEACVTESRYGVEDGEENLLMQTHIHGAMYAEPYKKRSDGFNDKSET